jgi:spermidine/putrescine transport system permease protein
VKQFSIARLCLGAFTLLVFAFMLAPVVVIVLLSFNASTRPTFPITGLTLRWYYELFQDASFLLSLKTSLLLAACSAAIALVAGTMASYALTRIHFRGRAMADLVLTLPLVLPHVVLGVAVLLALSLVGIQKSFLMLVLGHVVIVLPYVILTTRHRLQSIAVELDEAAATLGAGRATVIRTVTLPLAVPAIAIGAVFAFMQSFDEITATLFWRPVNTETVQTHIMGLLQFDVDPKANAMAGILVLTSVIFPLLAFCVGWILSRGSPAKVKVADDSQEFGTSYAATAAEK